MRRKRIILLGSSGSIGSSTLDVIRAHPGRLELVAASAHRNEGLLKSLCSEFSIEATCLSGTPGPGHHPEYRGREGILEMIRAVEADIVLNAIPGAAGMDASLAAAEAGMDLALANKESMVCAGSFIREALARKGGCLLPVDSEHSALFCLIHALGDQGIAEAVLTASGGPFRDLPLDALATVDATQALAHPTWSMGTKVTLDSATMANKGLEVMEAMELFGLPLERIRVLIHPESRVHALVRLGDGGLYAQISKPDMRLPIQTALLWPERSDCAFGRLDLAGGSLSFREVDPGRYPLFNLALEAARLGGGYPVAFNAANEVAGELFLAGRIGYLGMAHIVEAALAGDFGAAPANIGGVHEIDGAARAAALAAWRKEAGA